MDNPKEKPDFLATVEEVSLDDMEKYMEIYRDVVEVFKKHNTNLFDSYVVISSMSSALLQEILIAGDMESV